MTWPILLLTELEVARGQRRQAYRTQQDFLRTRRVRDVKGDFHVVPDLHQRACVLQGLERRIAGLGQIDDVLETANLGEGRFVAEGSMEDEGVVVVRRTVLAPVVAIACRMSGAAIGVDQLKPLPFDAVWTVVILIARREGEGIGSIVGGVRGVLATPVRVGLAAGLLMFALAARLLLAFALAARLLLVFALAAGLLLVFGLAGTVCVLAAFALRLVAMLPAAIGCGAVARGMRALHIVGNRAGIGLTALLGAVVQRQIDRHRVVVNRGHIDCHRCGGELIILG